MIIRGELKYYCVFHSFFWFNLVIGCYVPNFEISWQNTGCQITMKQASPVFCQEILKEWTQCPMASKYCWTVPLKQGTSDEIMKKKTKISWDNVPLNPTCVGHLEILCVKWRIKCSHGRTASLSQYTCISLR